MKRKASKQHFDRWIKLGFLISLLIISFSIFYYLVVFLPQKEQTRIEKEQKSVNLENLQRIEEQDKKITNKQQLEQCLSNASADYSSRWASNCKNQNRITSEGYSNCLNGLSEADCRGIWGYANNDSNCSLPNVVASGVEKTYKDSKDECYKKYPQ